MSILGSSNGFQELVNNKIVDGILTNPPHKTLPPALAASAPSAEATGANKTAATSATAQKEDDDDSPAAKKKKLVNFS